MKTLKVVVLIFSQIVLALTGIICFFKGIPLINCSLINRSTSLLTEFKNIIIPESAKCYFNNHGSIAFLDYLPFKEDKWPFIYFMVAALILVLITLILKLYYYEPLLNKKNTFPKLYLLEIGAFLGIISVILLNYVAGNFTNLFQIFVGIIFGVLVSFPINTYSIKGRHRV